MWTLQCVQVALLLVLATTVAEAAIKACAVNQTVNMLPFGGRIRESHDESELNINVTFNAFGKKFDGWRIRSIQGKGMGSFFIYPIDAVSGRVFELRTSRLGYHRTDDSYVAARVSDRLRDLKRINRYMKHAYPCADAKQFSAVAAFIHTAQCVQFKDGTDTFQTVITTDGTRTYVILIYSALSGNKGAQFGINHIPNEKNYRLTLDSTDKADVLMAETNGILPGIWVYDVTDRVPARPKGCGKTRNECTVTERGVVQTFSGEYNNFNLNTERKQLLMMSNLPLGHPCNILLYIVTDVQMNLWSLQIKLGVGSENVFFRDFYLMQKSFTHKGDDFIGDNRPTLPYTYDDGMTSTTLARTAEGFLLTSPTCGYQTEFRLKAREPAVRVTVTGDTYANKIKGLCGAYDGDFEGL